MADSLNTPTLPENRPDLEALIEAALARLDDLDLDPDLEETADLEPGEDDEDGGDDEPSLGSLDRQSQSRWSSYGSEADLELDEGDREPSLASTNSLDQRKWHYGRNNDLEDEHDGLEPVCEDEGAQCEDEGAYEGDCGFDEGDPGFADPGKTLADSNRNAMECAGMIEGLRTVQRRLGEAPVPSLRTLGGMIMR